MTKKEWSNLRIGARVTMNWPQGDGTNKTYTGDVVRINSNGSQVLVKWDGDSGVQWYGRLGIELIK